MITEELKAIHKERIEELYKDILTSFGILSDGIDATVIGMEHDHPEFITRMNLACDIFMASKLTAQFGNLELELNEIKIDFDFDDNLENEINNADE